MTKLDIIEDSVKLARKLKYVLIGTADANGVPHISAASELTLGSEEHVIVSAWFCPETLNNVERNPRIALVIWDDASDSGYQLVGEVEKLEDLAFLDGYRPQVENTAPSPQVERQLIVRVEKVIGFSHSPHTDQEIS